MKEQDIDMISNKLKLIYLAGKCKGNKWKIIKDLDISNIKFVSSDGEYSIDNSDNHASIYRDHNYREKEWDVKEPIEEALNNIPICDFVIAYVDSPDSFGTIAEIATASLLRKKIWFFINSNDNNKDKMIDAYWFISNFPYVTTIHTESIYETMQYINKMFLYESPIEEKFFHSLLNFFDIKDIEPQFWIDSKYRLDFVLPEYKICFECDGHEYHKTKEQRTKDNQRDRYLLNLGWKIYRFTGTEIYNNLIHSSLNEIKKSNIKPHINKEEEFKACMNCERTDLDIEDKICPYCNYDPDIEMGCEYSSHCSSHNMCEYHRMLADRD